MLQRTAAGLNAAKLRLILIITIVLLIALGSVSFLYFRSQLQAYAEQVSADTAAASLSSNDILQLQRLQQKLQDDSVAVTRAKNIVADSQYYQYQNQIISDITAYAKTAGISITSFAFTSDSSPAAAASAATAPTVPSATIPNTPAGLKTVTTSIAIKTPVNYEAIIRFIHSIEQNLTKMQLQGVSITKIPNNTDQVNVSPLTIEVYTR